MAEDKKTPEMSLDEQAMLSMLAEANAIERGKVRKLAIDGKVWTIRPTSQRQNLKMLNLDYDILHYQRELKKEDISLKQAKKYNTLIRKAYAKKAAYKVLGRRLGLLPFAFALMWRRIYNSSEQVSATINSEEAMLSANQGFYIANLGSSRRALVLSTMQVGNAVKQMQQREASAEHMLDEDASPTKQEDSK